MHMYVIFDEETGEVLQTHAEYVLGVDEPVAADEAEILELAREEHGRERPLAVTPIPDDFDPTDRTNELRVDVGAKKTISQRRDPGGKAT